MLGKFPNLEGVAILRDMTGLGGGTAPLISDSGLALLVEIPALKSIELGEAARLPMPGFSM